MGWSEGSEVEAEWTGVQPRGGQRYVLGALLCVCFLISDLIPLTSLAGRRSTAAGLQPQDRGRRC